MNRLIEPGVYLIPNPPMEENRLKFLCCLFLSYYTEEKDADKAFKRLLKRPEVEKIIGTNQKPTP